MSAQQIQAFITPTVLKWARERARSTRDRLAKRLHTRPEHITSWEEGQRRPSFKQAEKIAEALSIPFGYLFLPKPPQETLPLPDFRRIEGQPIESLSVDMLSVLNDVLFKQQRYREMVIEEGRAPLSLVKSFPSDSSPLTVAHSIRDTFKAGELAAAAPNWEEYLRALIGTAENLGILVMRTGIALGNTRRALSVEEFRGFAVSDPFAPVVFLNSRDSTAAQIFTFAHELGHIWTGESGISNPSMEDIDLSDTPSVERFCNAVAAEVLVPSADLKAIWDDALTASQNLPYVTKRFRVSTLVALRRAYDIGKLQRDAYLRLYRTQQAQFKAALANKKNKKSSGDFYNNLIASNSAPLTEAVVYGAMEGRTLFRDAAYMLNVNPNVIPKIADRLAKRRATAKKPE